MTSATVIEPESDSSARDAEPSAKLLKQTKCVTQATGGMASDQPESVGIDRDPLESRDCLQAANDVVGADAPEVEPLAAGDDGRQEFLRVGRGEDETGVRGRLFQRLQEGVCGRAGDLVRFVDDVDLRAKLGGRVADALPEIADVVDAAIAGRVDLDDIGRRTGVDGLAVRARVAGALARIVVQAVDGFGEHPRRRGFPGAARTAEEIGMGDPIEPDGVLQCADDVLLTDELIAVERLRAILAIQRRRGRGAGTRLGRLDCLGAGIAAGPSRPSLSPKSDGTIMRYLL